MPTNAEIMDKLNLICDSLNDIATRLRSVEAHTTVLSAVVEGHGVHLGQILRATPVPSPDDGA